MVEERAAAAVHQIIPLRNSRAKKSAKMSRIITATALWSG